jgi:putative MATE family efflux protein
MQDFTKGKVIRQIFMFALPMLVGNVFQQLYNIVDSVIVGRFLGKEALAAVGASFPVIFTLIAFIIGIGGGFSIVISQYFGAKNYNNVEKSVDTMLITLGIFSIFLTFIGIYFSEDIFNLLHLPQELIPDAKLYLNTYLYGTVLFCGFNTVSSTLRGIGDSKTPLYFLMISTITNIILDLVFIIGFDMGIEGVAWATVLSQGISFFSAVFYLNKYHKIIKYKIVNLKFDMTILKQAIRIGLPSAFQQTFVAMGMMAIMGIINTFGTNVIAAYTAASRIDSLALLPSMNFSQALSSFVGQNMGANNIERIRSGYRNTMLMSGLLCIFLTLIIIFFGEEMMKIFTTDPEVIAIGEEYLIIVSSFYLVFCLMFTTHGVLRGAGATLIPMFITLVALWVIRIPIAYILAPIMGETGIWWSVPCGWIIGLSASWLYYKSGKWKNKGVVKLQ